MSTIFYDAAQALPAPDPHHRLWSDRVTCRNCGFSDTGHFCSRCGDGLRDTEAGVIRILWEDLVVHHAHDLFALAKTTWLILLHPRRFFDGVLRRRQGLADEPFPLARMWAWMSEKPQAVHNAVKYFVVIYTLSIIFSWVAGEEVFGDIHLWGRKPLPEHVAEPLVLVLVVFLVWMYAATVALLVGRRKLSGTLTMLLLYSVALSLGAIVTMALLPGHVHVAWVCLGLMVYALFLLPQVVLPKLYEIGHVRLAFAQLGAGVANLIATFVILVAVEIGYPLLNPRWGAENAGAAAVEAASDKPAAGEGDVSAAYESAKRAGEAGRADGYVIPADPKAATP